jgi:hypothetical protein
LHAGLRKLAALPGEELQALSASRLADHAREREAQCSLGCPWGSETLSASAESARNLLYSL